MALVYEPNFVLASGDQPLTNARILHSGIWLAPMTAEPQATAEGFSADGPIGDTTHLRWSPRPNLLASPRNVGASPWATTGASVVGGRIVEDTSTGQHKVAQDVTVATASHTFTVEIRAMGARKVQLFVETAFVPFGTDHSAVFDLITGEIGAQTNTLAGTRATYLGDGWWRLRIGLSAFSGTVSTEIRLADASGAVSYTGGGSAGAEVRAAWIGRAASYYRVNFGAPRTFDTICIGRHSFGSGEATITAKAYNDATTSWENIVTFSPANDTPIWVLHMPRTSSAIEIAISGAAEVWMSNIKAGVALQMPVKANYGGVSPLRMAREDIVRSQESATGEYLGRTVQRVALRSEFTWEHLSKDWIEANWPAVQQGLRRAPYYIAWRPSSHDEVGFVQTNDAPIPTTMGVNSYLAVSLPVTGVGYE